MKGIKISDKPKIFDPSNPSNDKHLISFYNITTWSSKLVMRIKEIITKYEMSGCLSEFFQVVPDKIYGEQRGEQVC